jgi:hypothetical protein
VDTKRINKAYLILYLNILLLLILNVIKLVLIILGYIIQQFFQYEMSCQNKEIKHRKMQTCVLESGIQ